MIMKQDVPFPISRSSGNLKDASVSYPHTLSADTSAGDYKLGLRGQHLREDFSEVIVV